MTPAARAHGEARPMILKYVGNTEEGVGTAAAQRPGPLVVGSSYEVAEIYEWPWHLMVRKPGDRRWPAPDSPWFGCSADEFETPSEPVPILRCGFMHVERLTNFFGALVDNPLHLERFRALYFLRNPHYGEAFDAWYANPHAELSAAARYYAPDPPPVSAEVGRAFYDWVQFPAHSFGPPETGIVDEVFAPDRPLKVPFLYVGRSGEPHCCQGCYGTRAAALKACLDRLLRSLGIDRVEVGELNFRFWQRAEVAEHEVGGAAEEPPADDGLW